VPGKAQLIRKPDIQLLLLIINRFFATTKVISTGPGEEHMFVIYELIISLCLVTKNRP